MIFVTVGTQLPFERLIKAMDDWSAEHPDVPVFAQIGGTRYMPQNFQYVEGLSPKAYEEKLNEAKVIVGHVGMGTIITGMEKNKPLVLMPRHASKGEHRNDHQLSTAKRFSRFEAIDIVDSDAELEAAMAKRLQAEDAQSEASSPSTTLLATLSQFVETLR